MFAMSAAEFSLYLCIVVIICVLGLAFWTWTQFQDMQRHIKTIENLVYPLATHSQPKSEPTHVEQPLQSLTYVDDSDTDSDTDEAATEALTQLQSENVDEILTAIDNVLPENHENNESNESNENNEHTVMDTTVFMSTEQQNTLDSFFPTELEHVDMAPAMTTDKVDFNALSRKQLQELAGEKGIKGFKTMKKDELIEALTK